MTNIFEDLLDEVVDLVDDMICDEPNQEESPVEEVAPVTPVSSLDSKLEDAKTLVLPYIKKHEAFVAYPYFCPANVLTVGYGTVIRRGMKIGILSGDEIIRYAEQIKGTTSIKEANIKLRIKFGNVLTIPQAETLVINHMNKDLKLIIDSGLCGNKAQIETMLGKMNVNQIAGIISFVYNIGVGDGKCDGVNDGFSCSTMLKKMKKNPNDSTIEAEFKRWNRGGGKVLAGLVTRRQEEADLYFGRS